MWGVEGERRKEIHTYLYLHTGTCGHMHAQIRKDSTMDAFLLRLLPTTTQYFTTQRHTCKHTHEEVPFTIIRYNLLQSHSPTRFYMAKSSP